MTDPTSPRTEARGARSGAGAPVREWQGWHAVLVAGFGLFILAMTLSPAGTSSPAELSSCYLCEGALPPDVIRNLVLFVPLGAALALGGVSTRRATLIGVVLSAVIEAVQLWIPGRESSLSDVVCNGVGTSLGGFLAREWRRWLAPPAALASRLSLAAALGAGVAVAATGWLLAPSYTAAEWYAGWAPEFGHLGLYHGRLVDVHVGDVPLPVGRVDTAAVRERMRAGERLQIRGSAGPDTGGLAPILSIHDAERREVLIVGAERGDLVLRPRTRAADLRFEQPSLRVVDALAATPAGDPLAIDVWREDGDLCAEVNGARSCGLAFSAGRAWAFFFRLRDIPNALRRTFDGLWIAGLAIPVALWWRPRAVSGLALAAFAAAVGVLPGVVGLGPAGAWEVGGAALGLGVGGAISQIARRGGARRTES